MRTSTRFLPLLKTKPVIVRNRGRAVTSGYSVFRSVGSAAAGCCCACLLVAFVSCPLAFLQFAAMSSGGAIVVDLCSLALVLWPAHHSAGCRSLGLPIPVGFGWLLASRSVVLLVSLPNRRYAWSFGFRFRLLSGISTLSLRGDWVKI